MFRDRVVLPTWMIWIAIASLSGVEAHVDEHVLLAFEKRCMVCHDTYAKNKLAPPLVAVNQVYMRLSDNNMTLAMARIKDFLSAPSHERGLMKPAIKLYNLMPRMDLNTTQINDYAQVIIETEFETPGWFNEHYKTHDLEKPK